MDKLDLDEKSSLFLELASGKITFLVRESIVDQDSITQLRNIVGW